MIPQSRQALPLSPCKHPALSGLTIIELLVVVVVIAVLAGLTLAALGGSNEQAARKRTQVEISSMGNALEAYRSKFGSYPPALNGSNVPLTNITRFLQSEKIAETAGAALDPFGNPYIYLYPGVRNRATYDLYSEGRDKAQTNAYIGNW